MTTEEQAQELDQLADQELSMLADNGHMDGFDIAGANRIIEACQAGAQALRLSAPPEPAKAPDEAALASLLKIAEHRPSCGHPSYELGDYPECGACEAPADWHLIGALASALRQLLSDQSATDKEPIMRAATTRESSAPLTHAATTAKGCDTCRRLQAKLTLNEQEHQRVGSILQGRVDYLEGTAIPHARKQEHANGFQTGWHAALDRICENSDFDELRSLVPAAPQEPK